MMSCGHGFLQLVDMKPITDDPDTDAVQLSKPKVKVMYSSLEMSVCEHFH